MKRKALKATVKEKYDCWTLMKTSWRFQTREFFEKSTLHGVRYIAEEGRPFSERFLWFCLTTIGTIVTLITITTLWQKFQTNPTITGLDTDFHDWDVPFPSITLCPTYPTNETRVYSYIENTFGNTSALEDSISDYYLNFITSVSRLTISNLPSILKFAKDSEKYNLPTTNYKDILYKVVSECSDVIFDCEWKGSAYNCCEGFSPVLTEVGFCYIFNSVHSWDQKDNLRVSKIEEFKPLLIYETDSKWSIVVNMYDAMKNPVNVYIHNAEELPSLDMEPQHQWTGTINTIDFSEKHTYTTEDVKALNIQQRQCVFPQEIKLHTAANYTYSVCRSECRMEKAKQLCQCVPFFYKELDDYPLCDLKGLACVANQSEEVQKESGCLCKLGCMNTVYEVDKLIYDDKLSQITALQIRFVSWPMVRYKREVLFGLVDLLVAFGGIAGLFLGFSLLSAVEIVYYFTMRACCMLQRDRQQLRKLRYEYETRPRPDIDLSLKPYFLRSGKVTPVRPMKAENKTDVYSIPFLN